MVNAAARGLAVFAGTLLAALPVAAEPTLDGAVRQVAQRLELRSAIPPHDGLCIAVTTSIEKTSAVVETDLTRLIGGLLRGELERLAVRPLAGCPDGKELAALEASARAAGAEWLLWVHAGGKSDRFELRAELRRIDLGLWVPAAKPHQATIHAFAKVPVDAAALSSPAATPPMPDPPPVPGEPQLVRVGGIDARVLALSACDLTGDATPELVSIGDELLVHGIGPTGLELLARWSLESLPRARVVVRDPLAGIVCADLDGDGRPEIAAGHSSFASGQLIGVERSSRGLVLTPKRTLEGIPIAAGGGGLVFGRPDAGRNYFAREVMYGPLGAARVIDLGGPFFELSTRSNEGGLALTTRYEVIVLGPDLAPGAKIGTSGVGVTALPARSRTSWIGTSSTASAVDRLTIHDPSDPSARVLPLPGPVLARAVSASGTAVDVWFAVRSERGTQLFVLSLPERRR